MRHARVLAIRPCHCCSRCRCCVRADHVDPLPDNGPINTASLEVDFSKTHWGDAKAGRPGLGLRGLSWRRRQFHGGDVSSIAGQSERYVAQQMALIANGQRSSGAAVAMVAVRAEPHPQDMRDIGAYFATQKSQRRHCR